MLIAHQIALDPNNIEATYLAKACGVARFAYNWALAEWQKLYEEHKKDPARPKPSEGSLRRFLNSIKHEQFPWRALFGLNKKSEALPSPIPHFSSHLDPLFI